MMIIDSVRGLNMTMVRNEPVMRDLAKSNRENAKANRELTAITKKLIKELQLGRGRRSGEDDRRTVERNSDVVGRRFSDRKGTGEKRSTLRK